MIRNCVQIIFIKYGGGHSPTLYHCFVVLLLLFLQCDTAQSGGCLTTFQWDLSSQLLGCK